MKKLCLLLAACMALVVLAAPALAEPTDAQIIRLSNPTVTVDGTTVSGLDDLALQLALCESADGSVLQMIFDLFIGGENASSAMLQLDDTAVVALIGGMSSAYSVNYEDVAALMESGSAFTDVLSMAETWTLPDDIAAAMEAHAGDFSVSEPEVSTNADGVVMQYFTVSGDMTGCIADILRLIENDALINAMLDAMDSTGSLYGMTDGLIESGLTFMLDGRFGHDNFGYVTDAEITISMYAGSELLGSVDFTCAMAIDENDTDNVNCEFDIAMKEADDSVLSRAALNMSATENGFTMNCNEFDAEGSSSNVDIVCNYTNNMYSLNCTGHTSDVYAGETDFSITGTLMDTSNGWTLNANGSVYGNGESSRVALQAEYSLNGYSETLKASVKASDSYSSSSLSLDISSNANTGVFSCTLGANDGYDDVSIGLIYEPAADAANSGVVSLLLNDGVSDVRLSADVKMLTATVDTDKFYVDPSGAINVLTITPEQENAAYDELEAILDSIFTKLADTYPAVFGGY